MQRQARHRWLYRCHVARSERSRQTGMRAKDPAALMKTNSRICSKQLFWKYLESAKTSCEIRPIERLAAVGGGTLVARAEAPHAAAGVFGGAFRGLILQVVRIADGGP